MTPWTGFLDVPLGTDVSSPPVQPYAGALRVADTDLPTAPADSPLRVVVTGGAGQVAGPLALAARRGLRLAALEVTLRDPDDPAGNARRVVAAAGDAGLPDEVDLYVAIPGDPSGGRLAAADEVAAVEGALVLGLGSGALETWIDAALDRELPFSLRGGSVVDAVAALRTTASLWGDAEDLVAARRWCRSWACDDALTALTYLEGLA